MSGFGILCANLGTFLQNYTDNYLLQRVSFKFLLRKNLMCTQKLSNLCHFCEQIVDDPKKFNSCSKNFFMKNPFPGISSLLAAKQICTQKKTFKKSVIHLKIFDEPLIQFFPCGPVGALRRDNCPAVSGLSSIVVERHGHGQRFASARSQKIS